MVDLGTGKILGYLRLIGTGLFISVLTLLIVEGLASYALSFRDRVIIHVAAERERSTYDADLGWVNKPNIHIADMYGPGVYVRTNSHGFRNDRDFDRIVAEGQLRFICSGDSFTFGAGVDNDDTWCQLLGSLDPRFETLNMGQTGYGFDQAYLWYKRDALQFSHQVHLLAFITDNFYRMQVPVFAGYPKPVLEIENDSLVVTNVPVPRRADPFHWLARQVKTMNQLRTIQFVTRAVQKVWISPADGTGPAQQARNKKTREVTRQILDDLKSLSDERSIQFVLVYLPTRDELEGSYPTEWMEFMKHESKARGIPLVDIVSDFRLLSANEIDSMYIPGARPWGDHLNESGNAFVARVIYDTLRNHPPTAEILFPPERDQ